MTREFHPFRRIDNQNFHLCVINRCNTGEVDKRGRPIAKEAVFDVAKNLPGVMHCRWSQTAEPKDQHRLVVWVREREKVAFDTAAKSAGLKFKTYLEMQGGSHPCPRKPTKGKKNGSNSKRGEG